MKYFFTFFWAFLLIQMINYVVGSMLGVGFDFQTGTIVAVVFTILVFVLGAVVPDGPVEKESVQ